MQLDREFDFLVPDGMQVQFGQRVTVPFGRSKKPMSGFITDVFEGSEHATSYLISNVVRPVLTPEILQFARKIADRQCVAIGEILSLAIPDHMPTVELTKPETAALVFQNSVTRRAILGSGKPRELDGVLYPDWAFAFIEAAAEKLSQGLSALLLIPERSDVKMLAELAQKLEIEVSLMLPGGKKSDRFALFHSLYSQVKIVIGTRSAIYAPVANLGLIALGDDLDDSLREEGSPHTRLHELAMIRAGDDVDLLLAAPYRSVEVQRLVEIGYLKDAMVNDAPPRISFTEPGLRIDEAAFKLVRQSLETGSVLILLPRKGMASSVWCQNCDARQRCSCGGFIWEPEQNAYTCRICAKPHLQCPECLARSFRPGRKATGRTVAEIGKAFPNVQVLEATAQKQPTKIGKPNQILIATPGSAPRIPQGYSALLVLDPDVWLSAQSLQAEQLALRDWCEAMELVHPKGRVVIAGLGSELGKPLSLWQHRELAKTALVDLRKLALPPAVRSVRIEAESAVIAEAATELEKLGARRVRQQQGSAAFTFSYQDGMKIAKALRAVALKTTARNVAGNKRRGLKIVMDDLGAV